MNRASVRLNFCPSGNVRDPGTRALSLSNLVKLIMVISGFLMPSDCFSDAEPFKLLTVQTATVPSGSFVLGLTELGFVTNSTFIDTNLLMDAFYTPNIGIKTVLPLSSELGFVIGGRYLQFTGTSAVENYVKQSQPMIKKFQLNYQGYNLYTGISFRAMGSTTGHFNLQYANVSGSKVMNGIFGWNIPVFTSASVAVEGGYDFFNKIPRASLGWLIYGESFGLRLGATYVGISDPLIKIPVLPVLDLYWQFGEKKGKGL